MKTILVLSDTHRNKSALKKIANVIMENDYVFHLGDYYDDFVDYAYALKDKVFQVHGNCDYGTSEAETEILTEIEGVKIFATHGHNYGVKQGRKTFKAGETARGDPCFLRAYAYRRNLRKGRHNACKSGLSLRVFSPKKFCFRGYRQRKSKRFHKRQSVSELKNALVNRGDYNFVTFAPRKQTTGA